MTLRHATCAITALAAVLGLASPAAAGGTWLSPVHDRYDAGDEVTLIGYTSEAPPGTAFYGYLRVDPAAVTQDPPPDGWPAVHPTDLRVGPVDVRGIGRAGWQATRLQLSFTLPAGLASGQYGLQICDDPCTTGVGDVIGATVWVGIGPDHPLVREWPLDEPAIAELPDDAELTGPGYRITAGEVRAGVRPEMPRPDPQAIPDLPAADRAPTPAPPRRAPALADESPATPDVRATGDAVRGAPFDATLVWLAVAAGAAGAFFLLMRRGPQRKHIRVTGGSDGHPAAGAPRWPGKAVGS